jgi:uncharacterized coiled-coil protein SlyX
MTQVTDSDIRELKDLLLGLDKKIDIIDTRLVEVEKKLDKLDTKVEKLDERVDNLTEKVSMLTGKFDKLDERTKLGFWGFILRGVVLALIIGAGGYMLPIIAEYVHKLPTL